MREVVGSSPTVSTKKGKGAVECTLSFFLSTGSIVQIEALQNLQRFLHAIQQNATKSFLKPQKIPHKP